MKEYKVVLDDYIGEDGRHCTSEYDEDFDVIDYASVLYTVVEDVIINTGVTFEQLVERLRPEFE